MLRRNQTSLGGVGEVLMERGAGAFRFVFGGCVQFIFSWPSEESVLGLWSREQQLLRTAVAGEEPGWSGLGWVREAKSWPLSASLQRPGVWDPLAPVLPVISASRGWRSGLSIVRGQGLGQREGVLGPRVPEVRGAIEDWSRAPGVLQGGGRWRSSP